MKFRIIGMQGAEEFSKIKSITLPSSDGEITILPGHENMIVKLNNGTLTFINSNDNIQTMEIESSVALIKKDLIEVI